MHELSSNKSQYEIVSSQVQVRYMYFNEVADQMVQVCKTFTGFVPTTDLVKIK